MSDLQTDGSAETMRLTAEVIAAYLSNNQVPAASIAELIAGVHRAISSLGEPKEAEPEKPVPAVSIRKSITPDYLISLEDGKGYKSLKRHLTGRGMTPAQYREKWGLSSDYPMVASNYAKQRSELAKTMGLGRKREPEPQPEPVKKGRRKAA